MCSCVVGLNDLGGVEGSAVNFGKSNAAPKCRTLAVFSCAQIQLGDCTTGVGRHEAINHLSPRTCCKATPLPRMLWSWLNDLTSASSEKLPRAFCRLTLAAGPHPLTCLFGTAKCPSACSPLLDLDGFVGLRVGRKATHEGAHNVRDD